MYADSYPSSFSVEQVSPSFQSHQSLADTVRALGQRINDAVGNFPHVHYSMRELERLLLRGEEHSEAMKRVVEHFSTAEMTKFNDLYCLWETELERRFVRHLEGGLCNHVVDYPLFARFERLIDREVGLVDDGVPKKMLFIGSGPMPITAFCLHHRLDATIDCLERSELAAAESRVVIESLGLNGKINVFVGKGEEVDVSGYDAILIALLAKPKSLILHNILRTCRPDVRVICRTSEGTRRFFYEPTGMEAIPKQLQIARVAYAGIDDTISSYLLRLRS